MIPLWLALVLFFLCWCAIAIFYANGLQKDPLYIGILTNEDWASDEDINELIDAYGWTRIIIDLIMIAPMLLLLPFNR